MRQKTKRIETMKKNLLLAVLLMLVTAACQNRPAYEEWTKTAIRTAASQLKQTARALHGTGVLPRTLYSKQDTAFLARQLQRTDKSYLLTLVPAPSAEQIGKLHTCGISDWTSGFFPGSLWYAYELSGDEELKAEAIRYTNLLADVQLITDTHDVGFMIQCSYGNALRLAPNDTIKQVILNTADNLCARFNEQIGCIRSWDFGEWNFPVIIDNMMNLDLLFNATRLSGDRRYFNVAVRHAKTTMANHFRPDFTSYHVVSYLNDGTPEVKQTFQGKDNETAWARGQAWGLYGYTRCYKETGDTLFLNQARQIAAMIMRRVNTSDLIPYWDYNAPPTDETPRDASAATVTASALLQLSEFVPDGDAYADYATRILQSLCSDSYLAKEGENGGFILKHSTGSLPHGSEIDVPLNYADYYFLEALVQLRRISTH